MEKRDEIVEKMRVELKAFIGEEVWKEKERVAQSLLIVNRGIAQGWALVRGIEKSSTHNSSESSVLCPRYEPELPVLSGFHRLYCVATKRSLYFFENDGQNQPVGFMYLKNSSLSLNLDYLSFGFFALNVISPLRTVVIIIRHVEALALWTHLLGKFMNGTEVSGSCDGLSDLLNVMQ